MEKINNSIPIEMQNLIDEIKNKYSDDEKIGLMFEEGLKNTYQTTIKKGEHTTFVITGDIPAMWNRDAVAQVRPLLHFANESEEIRKIIRGVIEIQKKQVILDPYANAHNFKPVISEQSYDDLPSPDPMVWERKFEVDSLCYPIQLAYMYWKKTNDSEIFDNEFLNMAIEIIKTFIVEQNHHEKSSYSFRRIADWLLFEQPERIKYESLPNRGSGKPVGYTGMIWSGFRPSDDACQYGYLIPSNMFAVVVLKYLEEILDECYNQPILKKQVIVLYQEIEKGINSYGLVDLPKYGKIFAYEVDGLGNELLMDDANVPSLLSAPYIGYCNLNNEYYQNTRRFILSKDNPYFFQGAFGKGVGSPHTPKNYFWHIALAIEGLTETNDLEKKRILDQFRTTVAGSNLMHEGIDVNDPYNYTRPWFSWANSMFAEFILELNGISVWDD